jgi:hypothetical protein
MTIEDIENMLPSGFHDALLQRISIDYVKREALIDLDVCIGDPDANEEEEREAHRLGHLRLYNLLFLVIEPPDPRYPCNYPEYLMIDSGPIPLLKKDPPINLPELLPADAFTHYFFVSDWNAFIYLAATDASFWWHDDPESTDH